MRSFVATFTDWDGNVINPATQMDIQEFLNNFLDKIEGITLRGPHQNLVKDFFQGQNVTLIKGLDDCPHVSEVAEPFTILQLPIKNKKNL